MAKKIEIYENTLLKLLVRRGIDIDRKNVVLSEGELGYTTDLKKLYVGDGQTPGGIQVGGNSVIASTNDITSLTNVVEGDVVFSPSAGKLFRFKGGENETLSNWDVIGSVYTTSNGTINIDNNNNSITVGTISANNIHPNALGDSLTFDNEGKLTLSTSDVIVDEIKTSTPNGFLTLPGNLEINTVDYSWPSGGLQSDMYLSTDASGNLRWKALESTTTVLATSTASRIPVGTIMPFVSSTSTPSGWLLCNGQSVLKADYSDLFNVIGNTYGGDTTSFNIPNLINKSLYGVQNSPGSSTLYSLNSSATSVLSATGALFLIKAVTDPVVSSTITVTSPLTCSVDNIDVTNEAISPYSGDIVIGMQPPRELAGSTGYRNKVINGNFDFWQRGTATIDMPVNAVTKPRTADRWITYATGVNNATFSVTRQQCTATELDAFNANYYQRLTYKNGVGGNKVYSLDQFIGPNTDINIIADSSGSMNTTRDILNAAVTTGALKARLLPFYNNNETLYNQRVKFFENATERTYGTGMLNSIGRGGTKLINLVFQDETDGEGYESTNSSSYNADTTAFRTKLNSYALGTFAGIVFQVNNSSSAVSLRFKTFLQNVKLGLAPFTSLNLADKPEIKHVYDITAASTQQYYVDSIVNAILSLDINVITNGLPLYDVMDRDDAGCLAIQSMENAAEILGKTMTLSFWARASQPTKIFSETQIHSTQGPLWTPTINKVFDLTTSWQKFTHTYTMPTFTQVSAVAYDPTAIPTPVPARPDYTPLASTNSLPPLSSWVYQVDIKTHWSKGSCVRHGNSWVGNTSFRPGSAVNFPGTAMTPEELRSICTSVLSGVQGYYDIAQIQLEEGDTPTDFEFRPPSVELGMCQRYLEFGRKRQSAFGSHGASTYGAVNYITNEIWVDFKVTKYKAPTITFVNPTQGKSYPPIAANAVDNPGNTFNDNVDILYVNTDHVYPDGFMVGWRPDTPNTDAAPFLTYFAEAEI